MGGAFKKHDPATYRVAIAYVKKRLLTKPIQTTYKAYTTYKCMRIILKKPMLYYSKWQTLHLARAEHLPNDVVNS